MYTIKTNQQIYAQKNDFIFLQSAQFIYLFHPQPPLLSKCSCYVFLFFLFSLNFILCAVTQQRWEWMWEESGVVIGTVHCNRCVIGIVSVLFLRLPKIIEKVIKMTSWSDKNRVELFWLFDWLSKHFSCKYCH